MANERKIDVDHLQVGMYVSKLDRSWLDTPFLFQGFRIKDRDDLRSLRQYCEYVWVDMDLAIEQDSLMVDSGRESPSSTEEARSSSAREEPRFPVEEEHRRIHAVFQKNKSTTRDMLDDIRLGKKINTSVARDTVDDCVGSVLRNPDALVWLSKIRKESEYTAEHSLNVCILSVVFGRNLGLEKSELELLGLCGLLHDIGKMRVPMEILEKPGVLTDQEMKLMKAHAIHGRNLLLSTPSVESSVVDAAYSHHECVDGSGYPRKLSGEKISLFSRMISIVDAYDAMTANRCYQKAKPTTKALKIIYEQRGKQFDEALALQFIKTIGLFPVGSIVELYTGEIGIVVEANPKLRHLPRLVIVLDKNKHRLHTYRMVNLHQVSEGKLGTENLIQHVLSDGTHDLYLKDFQDEGFLLKY